MSRRSLTCALGTLACVFALQVPASALPAQTPDATWMVNSSVRALALVDGVIWIGGRFTQLRSAATGGTSIPVAGLAALDAATGVPVSGLHLPVLADATTPYVFDLDAREGVLYVGGNFDSVDGQVRHNLAAIDTATGDLLAFRAPDAVRKIGAVLAAPSGGVYVGGNQPLSFFTAAGRDVAGFTRQQLGIAPGSPNGAAIRDLTFGPDGSVFLAGAYDTLNGEPHHVVSKVDPVTGAVDPAWHLSGNVGVNAIGVHLFLDPSADAMYTAIGGSDYVARYRISDGAPVWKRDTSGASQTVALGGDGNLIVGGHFQWVAAASGQMCGKNTLPTFECTPRLRLAAFDQNTGALDPWDPDVTPLYLGIFALVVEGGRVHMAGDFKAIEGVPQLYYARLS